MTLRRVWPAAFAVVIVLGQLVALAHQASTRHVTCAQHGEQLEAAQLSGADDACGHAHFVGVDGSSTDHEDCAIARALHQSSAETKTFVTPEAPHVLASRELSPRPIVAIASELYLIAPKTSPPA
jgi:hypothetical protein